MSTLVAGPNATGGTLVRPLGGLRDVALIGGVGLSILFAHREAVRGMVSTWDASPMYSYGYTVPLISGYLLWTQRDRLQALTPRPALGMGVALVAAVILLTTFARISGLQVLDQLALIGSLVAAVLLLFGAAYVRTAWAALAYLVFMIPLWDGFTESLHEPFQLRSAVIGTSILHAIGVPAFREGMVISLPNLKIEVARACSGINYLVAVLALGLPLAYAHLPGIWRRAALLVSALLIAALSNGLRVALIGCLAYLEIGSPLHGPMHMLHGLFVAGIGYVALFAGQRLLSTKTDSIPDTRSSPPRGSARRLSWPFAAGLAIVFVMLGANMFVPTVRAVDLKTAVTELPATLGGWTSVRDLTAQEAPESALFTPDVALRRRYADSRGREVDVFVGYFRVQVQGHEMVHYRAASLHNGARSVRIDGRDGAAFDANLRLASKNRKELLFWYDLGDGPEATQFRVKSYTVWNAVRQRRTNGAVVMLTTPEAAGSTEMLRSLAPIVERAVAERLSDAHVLSRQGNP